MADVARSRETGFVQRVLCFSTAVDVGLLTRIVSGLDAGAA